jgi:hypothetical protein
MPYKNDNLEELFTEAAKDYPLRTDNSNWDSVASRLNKFPTNAPVASNEPVVAKSNLWKYAAILLLLLGTAAFIYFSQTNSAGKLNQADIAKHQNEAKQAIQSQPSDAAQNDISVVAGESANNTVDKALSGQKNQSGFLNTAHQRNQSDVDYSMLNKNAGGNLIINNHQNDLATSSSNDQNNSSNNLSLEKQQEAVTGNKAGNEKTVVENNNQKAAVANETNALSGLSKKDVIEYNAPKAKLYGSLFGGPQLSMVKSQQVENPGYKIGIALAYRINDRFDIEIGAQREGINYFTKGEYFDKSGLKLKDAASLGDLTAKSQMTSVPVTVRYNFQSKKNGHFYAGLGMNALVLTHSEKYQYTVSRNGTSNDKSKNYKSVTAAKYLTSINVSAGYQNKLSNWCDFKIEPYYQIPVKNLGVGKLPITSFGLNIGIVKDLNLNK